MTIAYCSFNNVLGTVLVILNSSSHLIFEQPYELGVIFVYERTEVQRINNLPRIIS